MAARKSSSHFQPANPWNFINVSVGPFIRPSPVGPLPMAWKRAVTGARLPASSAVVSPRHRSIYWTSLQDETRRCARRGVRLAPASPSRSRHRTTSRSFRRQRHVVGAHVAGWVSAQLRARWRRPGAEDKKLEEAISTKLIFQRIGFQGPDRFRIRINGMHAKVFERRGVRERRRRYVGRRFGLRVRREHRRKTPGLWPHRHAIKNSISRPSFFQGFEFQELIF